MLQLLGLTAGLISTIAFLPYVRDILKLKTKPERASWLIWGVLGSIAFFSQLAEGASDSLWMTAAQTLGVVLVFALSIKFGVGGLTKRDKIALVIAGIGLVLWYLTNEATIALFIVIIIDSIGTILTVIKTYKRPESETLISWVLYGASGFLALFAVGSFNLVLFAYPVYIFLANFAVVCAIYLGRRKIK